MTRVSALAILVVGGGLTAAAAGYQAPPQAAKVVEVEKLKDNLYMLKGGGGNTAVFIRTDGVTVVDTKLPGWGQPVLDRIKELTNKPITTIINTHTHFDHVSGNVEFPATVDVVVQEHTEANMKKMAPVTGLAQPGPPPPNIFTVNNGKGMPKHTFKDKMTLGKGADEIELFYFGRGHTNGDAWVLFPALRVAHAGDVFSGKNLPLLDANSGGSGVDIDKTLLKAANALKADTFITGHSTTMTPADVREYAQFNKDFLSYVQDAKKAGKSVDEAAAGWKIDESKYQGYQIQAPRLKSNIQVIYDELK